MPDLKSLLPKASAIRDATLAKENTALRVGTLFVDVITNADNAITSEKTERETADIQLQKGISIAHQTATAAQETADAAKSTADAAKVVTDSKGIPGGIAALDDDGKVTDGELPNTVYNVVEFDGILLLPAAPTVELSSAAQGKIYFVTTTNTFLRENGTAIAAKYYANWPGADSFGAFGNSGRTPKNNTIYIDTTAKRQYYWNGETLVALDAELMQRVSLQTPVRCTDEADLESKAASETYAEGQQFYIPETE